MKKIKKNIKAGIVYFTILIILILIVIIPIVINLLNN